MDDIGRKHFAKTQPKSPLCDDKQTMAPKIGPNLAATASSLIITFLFFYFCFTKREQYSREAIVRLIRTEQQWETTPSFSPNSLCLSASASASTLWTIFGISQWVWFFLVAPSIFPPLSILLSDLFPSKCSLIVLFRNEISRPCWHFYFIKRTNSKALIFHLTAGFLRWTKNNLILPHIHWYRELFELNDANAHCILAHGEGAKNTECEY